MKIFDIVYINVANKMTLTTKPILNNLILPIVSPYFERVMVPITFPIKKVAPKNPIYQSGAHLKLKGSTQLIYYTAIKRMNR